MGKRKGVGLETLYTRLLAESSPKNAKRPPLPPERPIPCVSCLLRYSHSTGQDYRLLARNQVFVKNLVSNARWRLASRSSGWP